MFKDPKVYSESNSVQQAECRLALSQFKEYFTWRDKERILDIGCGSGNTTTEILAPFLPDSFGSLVGADVSKEMILHARARNKSPKISFINFNVEESNKEIVQNIFSEFRSDCGFDKIFSFYCLHWVKNHRKALENVHGLVRPGGQCFFVFLSYGLLFPVWKIVSLRERWQPYLKNTEHLEERFPIPFTSNVKDYYQGLLKESGFDITACELIEKEVPFDPASTQFFNFVVSIDPLIQLIPEHLRVCYTNEVIQTMTSMALEKYGRMSDLKQLLVVLFSKSPD